MPRNDGSADVMRAADALAAALPSVLAPLARIAYNYRWSWTPGGAEIFASLDPHAWRLSGESPVRFLRTLPRDALERAAADEDLVARIRSIFRTVENGDPPEHPIAFFCTEFAVHTSLPIYSGGLGVLAGDILKEASDRNLPYVGVGLFYRQGYFRQRLDTSGWQHEYWTDEDPERLPAVLVTADDGSPLTITVRIRERDVTAQIWRIDVGRVPLYLLDAELQSNDLVDRWITSRLYVGDRRVRLAQYALLGIGGMRALRAMGFDPALVHLNEGHPALAPLELAREETAAGVPFEEALEHARARTVFTTHTPIAAGNESYTSREIVETLGDLPAQLGVDVKDVLALGHERPGHADEPFGLTPLGLRVSRAANGVSRVHGRVARAMWRHLYPDADDDHVPIAYVTNGVHLPSWMSEPMRTLLDRHLAEGWETRASDPTTWDPIEQIPAADLWDVRCRLREALVADARERATLDRLSRGESTAYVEAALHAFDPNVLTLGFARRAASYKRMYLLTLDPARALRLLDGDRGVQLFLAGKPHPQDEEGKRIVQRLFDLKWAPHVSDRVAFLEDYDLSIAKRLVAGCDVWLNLPRPPLEASGTSGMKAALNGGLNLSVLDGWWAEAFDGGNGWGLPSGESRDHETQDRADAAALYDVLENEVLPLFYERDEHRIPQGWIRRVKTSMRTIGPRFCATRMLEDYARDVYKLGGPVTEM
ncbi:MAG: alpha-glucan family phosphorylase [Actinomycetota bacterium]